MAVGRWPEREGAAGPGGAGGCRRGPEGAGPEGAGKGRRVPGPESAEEDRRMPSARCRGPKGAGSRKVPKEPGRTRKPGPGEPENRAREKSKEPKKPGRSPRSPEGAERKRGARRTTGPSSVLSPCFAGCPPVIGRSLADRWPVVGRLLCRLYLPITACFNWFSSCSPGRWLVVNPVVCWSFVGCLPGFPGMPTASPSVRGQFTGFVCRGSRSTGSSPAAAGVICQFCSAGFVGVR